MDVFNIMYLGLDEIKPEKQLDCIKLITDRGFQYLYLVDVVDIHKSSIKYGDSIPLMVKGPTYPSQCVSIVISFVVVPTRALLKFCENLLYMRLLQSLCLFLQSMALDGSLLMWVVSLMLLLPILSLDCQILPQMFAVLFFPAIANWNLATVLEKNRKGWSDSLVQILGSCAIAF